MALIDRCEKLELVKRDTGHDDRRVVEVRLLPKGEQLLAKIATRHQDELHTLLMEILAIRLMAGGRGYRFSVCMSACMRGLHIGKTCVR